MVTSGKSIPGVRIKVEAVERETQGLGLKVGQEAGEVKVE